MGFHGWLPANLSYKKDHAEKVAKISRGMALYVELQKQKHPDKPDVDIIDGDVLIMAYKMAGLDHEWIQPDKKYKVFSNLEKQKSLVMEMK